MNIKNKASVKRRKNHFNGRTRRCLRRTSNRLSFQATEITAVFTLAKTMQIDCAYFTGLLEDVPQELANIKEVVQQTLHFLKEDTFKGTLTLTSTIPAERGMGSSAATAVAIVRSLLIILITLIHIKNCLSLFP